MATLLNNIMLVDLTVPAGQRYIYLDQTHFDGSETGEGRFLAGYGPDRIPVYDTLKRTGNRVEIYLREGTGGAADEFAITLLVNPETKRFASSHDREHSVIPLPVDHYDLPASSQPNPANVIEIIARAGQTVTWTHDFPAIHNIEISSSIGGSGTVGEFNILIR